MAHRKTGDRKHPKGKERRSAEKKRGSRDPKRGSKDKKRGSVDAASGKQGVVRKSEEMRNSILRIFGRKRGDSPHSSRSVSAEHQRMAEKWAASWRPADVAAEWEELQKEYQLIPEGLTTTAFDAAPQLKKGRYPNIRCLDRTRVLLAGSRNCRSNFINANTVQPPSGGHNLILAMAPTKATLEDWWDMIYEQKVGVVVMLCQVKENGQSKCEPYVPQQGSRSPWTLSTEAGKLCVRLESESQRLEDGSPVGDKYRLASLSYNHPAAPKERKPLEHVQYLSWPDQGVPSEPHDLAALIRHVWGVHTSLVEKGTYPERSPILVHCSAGIGRSGTYALLDALLYGMMGPTPSLPPPPVVPTLLRHIRRQRLCAVQTRSQYHLVYTAAATALTSWHFLSSCPELPPKP